MQLIIILIICYFIWRHFKKKKSGKDADVEFEVSSTDKKQMKKFESAQKLAGKEFGPEAVEGMGQLANLYGFGSGVEQDLKKAAHWKLKQLNAMLHLKVYWEFSGFRDYSGLYDEAYEFFVGGEIMKPNLEYAWRAATMLFEAEEPRSAFLVQELQALEKMGIGKVKSTEEATEIYRQEAEKGNHFAMYRLARALEITLTDENMKKAEELKKQAAASGNLRGKYDLSEEMNVEQIYSQIKVVYLCEELAKLTARENARKELEAEMNKEGVPSDTASQVDWLLKKAGWPAAVAYKEPEVQTDQEKAFHDGREVERKGSNFKKAAKLYKPAAEAGHVEAMRRLGNILCNIRSSYEGDENDMEGRKWLGKAAAAGSVLAQFDLGKKETDPAKMAALARTGNPEALHHLAAMMLMGWGGPVNETVGRAFTRVAWNVLGDPIEAKDGEGMEWRRKLCLLQNRRGEDDQIFWAGNADKIGYAPGSYELSKLYVARKGGPSFQSEYASKAYRAGYERAYGMVGYLQEEERGWSNYCEKEITDALNKKGYLSNSPYSGEQLAQISRNRLQKTKAAVEEAYKQKGLPNMDKLEEGIIPEAVDTNFNEAEMMKNMAAENNGRETTVDDMPYQIYDDWNRIWERERYIGTDTAIYCLSRAFDLFDSKDYLNEGSVYISNRNIDGPRSATLFTRSFHW